VSKKWQCINEELAHREIMIYKNEGDIINFGGILYKVGHKWKTYEKCAIDYNTVFKLNKTVVCIWKNTAHCKISC
jgi:hypothetical protein